MRTSDHDADAFRAWAPATGLAAAALVACALLAIGPALRDADAADARAERLGAFAASVARRERTTADLLRRRDELAAELSERAAAAPRGQQRREHASGDFDELWARLRDIERSAVVDTLVLERGPGGLVLRIEAREFAAAGEPGAEERR
jgi:hypothetical protein